MTFLKVVIHTTSSSISNKLGNIYTISRRERNVTTEMGEIDDSKIKVVSFVIQYSRKVTFTVKFKE